VLFSFYRFIGICRLCVCCVLAAFFGVINDDDDDDDNDMCVCVTVYSL